MLNTSNPGITPIFIQGTAHCANMLPPSPSDPPGLVAARQEISSFIDVWLHTA